MARLNLTEAAKAANVSRSTLYRHIKEGRISRTLNHNNEPVIDVSELMRVYGELEQRYSTKTQPIEQRETDKGHLELQQEIEILKLKLEHAEELKKRAEEAKVQWQEQAEKLALMLTHQQPSQDNSADNNEKFQKFFRKLTL